MTSPRKALDAWRSVAAALLQRRGISARRLDTHQGLNRWGSLGRRSTRYAKDSGRNLEPGVRWSVTASTQDSVDHVYAALTIAESVAHDKGFTSRAQALTHATSQARDGLTTTTFTVIAPTQEAAIDKLRTHLGAAAIDLHERHRPRHAQLMRALSASAE